MTQQQFFDWQTAGGVNDVTLLVATLEQADIPWCVIGGLAVNHWSLEPMATADVDLVVAAEQIEKTIGLLTEAGFTAETFDWSINFRGRSKVSVQLSTEEMYRSFPSRAVAADVHGMPMRVASLEDTLRGKLAAVSDVRRRPSKRQKDLADISRLLEAHPALGSQIPPEVEARLER